MKLRVAKKVLISEYCGRWCHRVKTILAAYNRISKYCHTHKIGYTLQDGKFEWLS